MIEENIYNKEKTQKLISTLKEILERIGVTIETVANETNTVNEINAAFNSLNIIVIKSDEFESNKIPDDDITSLKKKIKYCKNPLEKKNLEQRLNVAYKKRKRKNGNLLGKRNK